MSKAKPVSRDNNKTTPGDVTQDGNVTQEPPIEVFMQEIEEHLAKFNDDATKQEIVKQIAELKKTIEDAATPGTKTPELDNKNKSIAGESTPDKPKFAKVTLPTSGKTITATRESLERAFQLIDVWSKGGGTISLSPRDLNVTDEIRKGADGLDGSSIPHFNESSIERSHTSPPLEVSNKSQQVFSHDEINQRRFHQKSEELNVIV